MSTTTVYAPILKAERNTDGDLVVVGKATGPDLDLDQQVCDPVWLKEAMPRWFSTGGNIREQHSSIAAGVATELSQNGDAWMVTATVVDPVSAKKVEAGVLKGYSIGIKNPQVIKDKAAPGGRIVGGTIVETSLVDRPCNPTCTMTLAKAAKPGMTLRAVDLDAERMLVKVEELHEHPDADDDPAGDAEKTAEPDEGKRDVSTSERDRLADCGQALPDGSFPIANTGDLKNAVRAIGRAKDPAKAKAHIKRRARALGRTDLVPDDWKNVDPDQVKADDGPDEVTHDPAEIAAVRDGLVALIKAELDELCDGEDELCDITGLLCSLKMLMCWWDHEAGEGETVNPYPNGDSDNDEVITVPLAAEPETPKTPEPDAAKTVDGPDIAELVKTAVAEANEASEERIKALEAELAKVNATPVPGGPVLTRTAEDTQKAAAKDELLTKVNHYRRLADQMSDATARRGYLELAKTIELDLAGDR